MRGNIKISQLPAVKHLTGIGYTMHPDNMAAGPVLAVTAQESLK